MAARGHRPKRVQWGTTGKDTHSALGKKEVLLISLKRKISNQSLEVIPRRHREKLTAEERQKLENQGVPRNCHHDDLSVLKTQYSLDKQVHNVEVIHSDSTTCEELTKIATRPVKNADTAEVILHYVGPGKKGTGDWCFSDGFITFREIMDLYMTNPHFKGLVLTIISDCSYSGSWVREAMAFMDKQGVGPCGHVARKKGILVKVFASCLADEIPINLSFSVHGFRNRENNEPDWFQQPSLRGEQIHDGQHLSGIDFTEIRCLNKIDEPCTMAPESTWERWNTTMRIFLVRGEDEGRPAWHCIKVEDKEDTRTAFLKAIDSGKVDVAKFGKILKSGWGKDPPNEFREMLMQEYTINYE